MRELGNFYGTKESYQILMAPMEFTLVAFVLHFQGMFSKLRASMFLALPLPANEILLSEGS